MLELTAGVGGKEAMLFTRELFDMYCGYINYKVTLNIELGDETDIE